MKKVVKILLLVVVSLFLTTALNSCKGDDGVDGIDGVQGPAGQDGNANVQTYVYNSPSWGTASGMNIDMIGILTDDVIQNDAVLVYINHGTVIGDKTAIIPGSVWDGYYRDYAVFLNTETLNIVSLETDGSFTPNANLWNVNWVKVIIIASTNTTTTTGNGRVVNTKQVVINELANAGIDINDYYAVCDYYGLAY